MNGWYISWYWILLWEELGYGMTSCEIFGKFRFRVWKPGDFAPSATGMYRTY